MADGARPVAPRSWCRSVVPVGGAGGAALTVACLLPALLIGLLPRVRELEVTAARSMLGVTGELVVPQRPRPEHRVRTVAVVAVHLVAGLVAAVGLVGVLPGAVVLVVASVRGDGALLASAPVPPVAPALSVLLGALAAAGVLLAVRLLGRVAAVAVARLLAPTAADRLAVAVARLAAEAEQNRLARELHDGIGHALTIIGVRPRPAGGCWRGTPTGRARRWAPSRAPRDRRWTSSTACSRCCRTGSGRSPIPSRTCAGCPRWSSGTAAPGSSS